MEIQCPRCGSVVEMEDPAQVLPCPGCGITLEKEAGCPGFALVSAAPDSLPAAEAFDPLAPPKGDPILEDHGRWKVASIFAAGFGLTLSIVVGMLAVGDYSAYGTDFFRKASNRFFLLALASAGILFTLGGVLVFSLVERESRRYVEAWRRRAARDLKTRKE